MIILLFKDSSANYWHKGISLIATRSPLLLSKEHLKTELHFNTAIKNDQVSQVNFFFKFKFN